VLTKMSLAAPEGAGYGKGAGVRPSKCPPPLLILERLGWPG
jgi:hypothetical protein